MTIFIFHVISWKCHISPQSFSWILQNHFHVMSWWPEAKRGTSTKHYGSVAQASTNWWDCTVGLRSWTYWTLLVTLTLVWVLWGKYWNSSNLKKSWRWQICILSHGEAAGDHWDSVKLRFRPSNTCSITVCPSVSILDIKKPHQNPVKMILMDWHWAFDSRLSLCSDSFISQHNNENICKRIYVTLFFIFAGVWQQHTVWE